MVRVLLILLLVTAVVRTAPASNEPFGPPAPAAQTPAAAASADGGPDESADGTLPRESSAIGASEDRPIGRVESRPILPAEGPPPTGTSGRDLARTIGALAGVIALILALGWGVRAVARRQGGLFGAMSAGGRAPSAILEVIGRYPLGRGLTLVLLNVDQRILPVSQSSGGRLGGMRMETLCEIDEPEDVASILLKSHSDEEDSLARRFSAILRGEDEESRRIYQSHEPVETRVSPASLLRDRLEQVREWRG
ncbi:MAG: hypothetical protein KDA28_08175 [Phycisphaerales bacterium]|nr:hypothetical protein [Phycisphaerales bacterium]